LIILIILSEQSHKPTVLFFKVREVGQESAGGKQTNYVPSTFYWSARRHISDNNTYQIHLPSWQHFFVISKFGR
jgi:hypothetical protein